MESKLKNYSKKKTETRENIGTIDSRARRDTTARRDTRSRRARYSKDSIKKPSKIIKKEDYSTFTISRKISPEIPIKCIVNINNDIYIKNTNIKFVDIIGHGGSSIIIKAVDQKNGKKYTIKGINIGHSSHIKLEVDLMKKALIFIKNNINPHFIVYHNYFKCNKVNDDDINGFYNHIFKEYFYIIMMELFEGDTTKLLYNMNIDNIIKKNVNTQIFLSLLSFHILLKVKHNDVKHANFFYKKIKSNDYDYIHYIIYDINVYVKNMGYIIVIGDYGQCDINNTEENKLEDYAIIEELGIKNYFYKAINENPIKTIKNFTTEKKYILYLINHTDIFNTILPVDGITLNNKPFILQ